MPEILPIFKIKVTYFSYAFTCFLIGSNQLLIFFFLKCENVAEYSF